MKRLLVLLICICFLAGCNAPIKEWPTKLYINGEKSGVPNVYFEEDYVILPLISVLSSMGAEWDRSTQQVKRIKLYDRVFCYDIDKQMLYLERYESSTKTEDNRENNTEQGIFVLLPSPKISDPRHIKWLNAEIHVDEQTLKSILETAGIDVQITVDYPNELIYLDVLSH